MIVGQNLKDIKYVAVEIIRNNATKASDIECGLFMGICSKKDSNQQEHKFLAALTNKSTVRLYNTSEYKIVTVDLVADVTRYMTVFTNETLDQAEAILLLEELTAQLDTEGKIYINDPSRELIDPELYTGYPEAVLLYDNLTQEKSDTASTAGARSTGVAGFCPNTTYAHTPIVEKEPEVTIIKRKGRLPGLETLTKMRESVKLIATGQVVVKALPIPDCDQKKEEKVMTGPVHVF